LAGDRLTGRTRLIAPVIMTAPCVSCHNSHPDSPKQNWKIGDVRGIQEVSVAQPIAANLLSFKWLLG
jgi:adenylate cyclase